MRDAPQPISEARLIRLQALSGLAFGTFLVLHLANTIAAAAGQGVYDAVLGKLRWYYQLPPVEVLAIGVAGTVHAVCGLLRRRNRRIRRRLDGRRGPTPAWLRIHRISGYFLLVVILGHVAATRGPGLFVDVPADFSFLTFSLEHWPFAMWPYYFVLFSCGTYHAITGGIVALSVVGLPIARPDGRGARLVLAAGLLAGAAGILAMGGVIGEVDTSRFAEFRAFYEEYLPFMRVW